MIDFFPKADCKFIPPPVDEAVDGDHIAPKDELINPDGTMNDCFLGNPDITDDAMIGWVWKDASDPRVFVMENDYRNVCPTPKVLAYRIGPDLVPSECFSVTAANVAKGLTVRVDPPGYVHDRDTVSLCLIRSKHPESGLQRDGFELRRRWMGMFNHSCLSKFRLSRTRFCPLETKRPGPWLHLATGASSWLR